MAVMVSLIVVALTGCSSTRHVPAGSYLLDNVRIVIERSDSADVRSTDLVNYLRQTPNHRVLGFLKLQLATYNMSGSDTSRWYNRWIRRMGQPPVIFNQDLTEASARQLRLALINKGYMDATVTVDSVVRKDKKKIDVTYNVSPGVPHRIRSVRYEIPDTAVSTLILTDTTLLAVGPGDKFDRNELDAGRTVKTEQLRNNGY